LSYVGAQGKPKLT